MSLLRCAIPASAESRLCTLFPTCFRGMLAKVQLEGGLAKKAARATASVIMDLLDAAEVLTSFPAKKFGFLLGMASEIQYVPRENWNEPAKLHEDLSTKGGLCWIIDLKQVPDDLLSAMIPVIQDHVMQEFGFVSDGPGQLGVHRLTLRDGTILESETFESLMKKLQRHRITAALAEGARRTGRVDPADLADMEDMHHFVGYADAQEFSDDIANVRKALQELSAKWRNLGIRRSGRPFPRSPWPGEKKAAVEVPSECSKH